MSYGFRFRPAGARIVVAMDVTETDGGVADDGADVHARRVFAATQEGRRVPLTGPNLVRTLLRFPLVTLRTIYLIHRQALRLWRARTPFHRRPVAPDDGFADLTRPRAEEVVTGHTVPSRSTVGHLATVRELAP